MRLPLNLNALLTRGLVALCVLATPLSALAQGTVVSWGTHPSYPTTSVVPGDLPPVASIEAGWMHTVAVLRDGSLRTWGGYAGAEQTIPEGLSAPLGVSSMQHNVAIRPDGTVIGWGPNSSNLFTGLEGATDIPEGLSGVTAVAAGFYFNLALKSDGTVVGWGANRQGQCDVPAGLAGVVAVSAGGTQSLALLADGTVVAWGNSAGGLFTPPAGLSGVVAIASGFAHNLALKSDGTVVAWGNNQYGQLNVPAGLTGVVAIAAGFYHNVALKSDGTVVAWGYNEFGQTNVPSGLRNVVAISAGAAHTVALVDGLTPSQAINDLKDYVNAQPIKAAIRNALTVKLDAALAALALPDLPLACTRLQDFINLVNAQKAKKQITAAQANYMIAQATDIKLLAGCP